MDNHDLPNGWVWTTVRELATNIQYGFTESATDDPIGPKFLRITDIQNNQVNWDTVPYCKITDSNIEKYLLQVGDIVFARTGATTGKSYLITQCPKSVFASYLIRLQLREKINGRYISFFLNSPMYWSQIMIVRKGSAQPGINAKVLSSLIIPLPPLPEQERIVERIESLFTQLDAGVAGLKRVKEALKRYKASVLKAACEGKLVPLDPNDEPAEELLRRILVEKAYKYHAPEGDLQAIPRGWVWARLDQFTQNYDGKRIPVKASDREMIDGKYPYYGASGIIDQVNEYIFDGDYLLIAEDGANLLSRSTPIAFQAHGKFWVNNHAHVVCTLNNCPLGYVECFLNSLDLKFYITGTAQPKLTQANLNKIPIPIPPMKEQHRIVAEVERRFSVIKELEQTIEANLKHATRLRQAILKHAFEGKLV